MDRIIEMWVESSLIQGILALMVMTAIIYMAVTGQQIPDVLGNIAALVVGFYFGQKVQQGAEKLARQMMK